MNVNILPYIDRNHNIAQQTDNSAVDSITAKNISSTTGSTSNSTESQNSDSSSFDSALKEATARATAALAIDKLVKASQSGSVDAAEVQNFFDQHNINITVSVNNEVKTSVTNTSNPVGAANTMPLANTSNTSGISDTIPSMHTSINPGDIIKPEGYSNSGVLACSDEYEKYFEEASATYGVDLKLLKAIAKQESNFNPNDVSHSGAVGIMQLMPATAAELGVSNSYDPYQNIMGGSKYIAEKISQYNGDVSLALAAYNAGSGNVAKYGGIPPFKETQNYVRKVIGYYNS